MTLGELVGKTIIAVRQKRLVGYDDTGFLEIKFSDGTKVIIEASYDDWTGKSFDEYPTRIRVINNDYHSELEYIIQVNDKVQKLNLETEKFEGEYEVIDIFTSQYYDNAEKKIMTEKRYTITDKDEVHEVCSSYLKLISDDEAEQKTITINGVEYILTPKE